MRIVHGRSAVQLRWVMAPDSPPAKERAMSKGRRVICLLAVCTTLTALTTVTIGAVANWASEEALGDVAVTFGNQILVLDNAEPDPVDPVDTITVTGGAGLAFDAFLNLRVTKTNLDGTGEITRFGPLHSHSAVGTAIPAPPSASAIAIASDGTIYTAARSLTSDLRATIWRIKPDGTFGGAFTVPADSTTCIGIDLDPDPNPDPIVDGSKLYFVTGGRTVRIVTGIQTVEAPIDEPVALSASLFTTLPGNGTACGIRLLAPPDKRETPEPPLDLVRLVVADGRNVKLLSSRPGLAPSPVVSYDAGTGSKNWIDVALDPNVEDFWAVDAGSWQLAKFRRGTSPTTRLVRNLPGEPRGVAINGELRAAQTVGLIDVVIGAERAVKFWPQNTATAFGWVGTGTTAGASFAIQAFEVSHDVTGDDETGLCPPSLNIRCRLVTNFDDATPKLISRGRSVVIREIVRSTASSDIFRIGIAYLDLTAALGGVPCKPNVAAPATSLLRDPWPHAIFTDDVGLVFYGGDDTVYTKTTRNDNIVVSRSRSDANVDYFNLRIINPNPGTSVQVGRSLPVAVEITNPFANCIAVPNRNESLVLSVTDVTTSPGTPVGDSEGLYGDSALGGTGLSWAFTANQYRTNLPIDSRFTANRKYRLCVSLPASTLTDGAAKQVLPAPLAAEQCRDFTTKR
jgi:hypothetical protein